MSDLVARMIFATMSAEWNRLEREDANPKAICANCGYPQTELVRLAGRNNETMVECLSCHTTPTRANCEAAAKEARNANS